MDDIKTFKFDFNEVMDDVWGFNSVNSERELKDPWQTEQQSLRDVEITKLLTQYVENYKKKTNSNYIIRFCILGVCALIIVATFFCCIFATIKLVPMEDKAIEDIASLITVYGGVIASVMGIVKITTKYIFPENEEQYITEIVKSIQDNDLANKKVNIEAKEYKAER